MHQRRLFQNIENTNQNKPGTGTLTTKSTDFIVEKLNKTPTKKQQQQQPVDITDIEHFKNAGWLNYTQKFQLNASTEYNQDAFMLFNSSYFGLITKCYDEYENQYDTMLRIYPIDNFKEEKFKLQLLGACDSLIDCQVINRDSSEYLILLVNQSNNKKMLKILHFNDEVTLTYEFNVFNFDGERQRLYLCTTDAEIYVLSADKASCCLYKFDLSLNLTNSINFLADLSNINSIFNFSTNQIGLLNKKSAKIDILNINTDYAIITKTISLASSIETEFIYFDTKSRMYLLDDENKNIKVYNLKVNETNKASFLFEFSLKYPDSGTCITRFFLDKNLKFVFLVDSLNKTFFF